MLTVSKKYRTMDKESRKEARSVIGTKRFITTTVPLLLGMFVSLLGKVAGMNIVILIGAGVIGMAGIYTAVTMWRNNKRNMMLFSLFVMLSILLLLL